MKPFEVFKQHKNLKEYHETSDGNKFHDPLVAKTHAKGLKDKEVKVYKRKDFSGKITNKEVKLSAEERVKTVMLLETVEAVEEALKDEKAKSVLAAGAERIEKLNITDDNVDADQETE